MKSTHWIEGWTLGMCCWWCTDIFPLVGYNVWVTDNHIVRPLCYCFAFAVLRDVQNPQGASKKKGQRNKRLILPIYIYSNMWQKDRVIGQPKPKVTICVKYLTSNSENGTHSKHQKDRQVIYHITTMFVSILLFYFLWLLHAISAPFWKGCYMPFRPHLERRKIPCHGGLRLHLYPLGYRVKGEDKRRPWASWFHSASCSSNVCRVTLMIWNKVKQSMFFFCLGQTALFPDHAWLTKCHACSHMLIYPCHSLPFVNKGVPFSSRRDRSNLSLLVVSRWRQWCEGTQKAGGILYTCRWVYVYLCLLQFSFCTDYKKINKCISIYLFIYLCALHIYLYIFI